MAQLKRPGYYEYNQVLFEILKAVKKVLKKNIRDKEELYQLTLVLDELHSMFDVSCAD